MGAGVGVALPEGCEGGVAEEEGKEVVVAVFELLALDGGVLAAVDEDELRVPVGEVFDHPAVLEVVECGDGGGGEDAAWGDAGGGCFAAEDGGQEPEVVGALGPSEVVALDGHHGRVDGGGEDGHGGVGWERGEEGWVGGGDGEGAVGGEGVSGEVGGEGESQDAERGDGGGEPARDFRQCGGFGLGEVEELEGEGGTEEVDCGELLVVPAGALDDVRESCCRCSDEEDEDGGGSGLGAEVESEGDGGEDAELDGFQGESWEREMADGPVGVVQDGQGGDEVERSEVVDGGQEIDADEGDEDGFGAEELADAGGCL